MIATAGMTLAAGAQLTSCPFVINTKLLVIAIVVVLFLLVEFGNIGRDMIV